MTHTLAFLKERAAAVRFDKVYIFTEKEND
jgi:hypothetical protein